MIDLQDAGGVEAIYIVPMNDGREACIVMRCVGGQKTYARFWPRIAKLEWGWILPEDAVKVWGAE